MTLHDPRVMDPDEELVRRAHLPDEVVSDVVRVLEAMAAWSDAERAMREASQRYMRLGENDMRALRFLISAQRRGIVATPGGLAAHLGISTASTTKLLDRLAAGGHILRRPHPTDRRSLAVEVTDETRNAARESVGRAHARRFDAIAALDPEDRAAVVRFFESLMATAGEGIAPTGPGVSDSGPEPPAARSGW